MMQVRTLRGRSLIKCDRGVTAVEFGIVGTLFLVLVIMVFQIAFSLFQQSVLDNGTRAIARFVQIHPDLALDNATLAAEACKDLQTLVSGDLPTCTSQLANPAGSPVRYCLQTSVPPAGFPTAKSPATCQDQVDPIARNSYAMLQVIYTSPFYFPISTNSPFNGLSMMTVVPFQIEPQSAS